MNIRNSVAKWILGKYSFLGRDNGKSYLSDFSESYQNFADVIFLNTVELLTDITNDVTLVLKAGNQMLFSEFNVFFNLYGQQCLNRLFEKGFAGDSISLLVNDSLISNKTISEEPYTVEVGRFAEQSALLIVDNNTELVSTFDLSEKGGAYQFEKESDGIKQLAK